MTFLGNVLWFVFGGWLVGTVYLLGALLFFPLLPFLIKIVGYSYWPFGRKPIPRSMIAAYRRRHRDEFTGDDEADKKGKVLGRGVLNAIGVVWACTVGWILALACLGVGLVNLLLCVVLVTIPICLPNALGYFKLARVSFVPMRYRIIRRSLADEILDDAARSRL